MNYQELEKAFPEKRLTKIINCTKDNPMAFTEIVVYSCLIQRATHGKGATQKQISKATRLNASTSVPCALARLEMKKLAEKRGKRWIAIEPAAEKAKWFRDCRGSGDQAWYRRLSYWWMGLPVNTKKPPFTIKQVAVYFKLLNLQDSGRWQNQQGLTRLLRIDRKTVRTALTKLKQSGLVDDDLSPNMPTPNQLRWFRNRPEKRQFRLGEQFDLTKCGHEGEIASAWLDGFGPMMIDAGYSERQIVDFFQFAIKKSQGKSKIFFAFLARFQEMFKQVEADHHSNRALGKYQKTPQ
jgi:hypothetical protein